MDFLVAEYIPGQTLDASLANGPLPERDVVRLGLQLVEGLEAAHEQGVIHRDLKPANLRLTATGRLKILDFGIAELIQRDSPAALTATLTQSHEVTGTLPYMAPEQLRGERCDERTDIWSAGVVLYELATGSLPFSQDTAPVLMSAILKEAPKAPATINPHISSGLQKVIVKALEKDPNRRYQSATELRTDLERLTRFGRSASRDKRLTAAVALLLALFAGVFSAWRLAKKPRGSGEVVAPALQRGGRVSVAILEFKNLSGRADVQWLSTALSEMLTTELAAGGHVHAVPEESVARMKIDLSIPDAVTLAPATLARIDQVLHANFVVLGSYLCLGQRSEGGVRLDLRLQNSQNGETVASLSVKGTEAQLDEVVSRAGSELRRALGVPDLQLAETGAVKAAVPTTLAGSRLYAEGLEKLRRFETIEAANLLKQAIAIEPKYPLTHAALARAWSYLGYDHKAEQEIKQAFDLSSHLAREDRLSVEGRYREITHDFEGAAENYRTLFNFYPDNLDYGLQLARNQVSGGKADEAFATISRLRRLPHKQGEDPQIDLVQALAARLRGDFRDMETLSSKSAAKAQALGSRLLVARARNQQGCVANSERRTKRLASLWVAKQRDQT